LRALTVQQPWAWAIIHGGKDVENRGRNCHFRGRFYNLLLHARTGPSRTVGLVPRPRRTSIVLAARGRRHLGRATAGHCWQSKSCTCSAKRRVLTGPPGAQLPRRRSEILAAGPELEELPTRLLARGPVAAHGLAQVRLLLTDGSSP
jgi:hypothetical protein